MRHPHDKRLSVSLRDGCAANGSTPRSQQRRIESNPLLRIGLARCRIQTAGGMQNQDFFQVDLVASWQQQINATRIKDESHRARLFHVQLYLAQETYAALARLSGWAGQSSAAPRSQYNRAIRRYLMGRNSADAQRSSAVL